jgi:hypothetical protein
MPTPVMFAPAAHVYLARMSIGVRAVARGDPELAVFNVR